MVIATFPIAAALCTQAMSYTYYQCNNGPALRWKENSIKMRFSNISFTEGTDMANAMNDTIKRFNRNPSQFRIKRVYGDNDVRRRNGQNETWITSGDIGDKVAGRTFLEIDCGNDSFKEADVVFASNAKLSASTVIRNLNSYNYVPGQVDIGSRWRSIRLAAIHEFGHAAGLNHTSNTYNVMGSAWTHVHAVGDFIRAYIGEDAGVGLMNLYGRNSSKNIVDLSATAFRRSGSKDGYSLHKPTLIRTTSNENIGTFRDKNDVLGYKVNRGQTYKVQFGFENLGEVIQRGWDNAYFISSDNIIKTSDQRVATYYDWYFTPNAVDYVWRKVKVPSDLVRGKTYYLGMIVDVNNDISESYEGNNTVYIPIKIN